MLRRTRLKMTPERWAELLVVAGVIWVVLWQLHPSLLFSSTTITGGDTGAHLATAAYLRTSIFHLNVTPWYPGWFAGMPSYSYYFVLPDALAALGSYVIGFAVAFKLATILGSLFLPISAFTMARLFGARRPIPAACAAATLPFLFDGSFTIDGGNLFSTMAGEYAFSLSLSLALITLGLFARGIRTGKGLWLSAISLSLTLAAHLLPWLFALVGIALLLVLELIGRNGAFDADRPHFLRGDNKRALRFVTLGGAISLALSAWWLLPFVTTQNLTNSMNYSNDPVNSVALVFSKLGWTSGLGAWGGDRWVIILALLALIVSYGVRDRLGITLTTMAALSALAFVLDPQSSLWNERLVPFWFITIYLSAGWFVGYVLLRWINRRPRPIVVRDHTDELDDEDHELFVGDVYDWDNHETPEALAKRRTSRTVFATYAAGVLALVMTVPPMISWLSSPLHVHVGSNQVRNWSAYNYEGYQKQAAWPEYNNLIDTMERVAKHYGCGRAMWEYNANEGRFGTPEALMLLPYWTNNCVASMQGLFFESSATTPYHFLDQAELSAAPSDPQVGLPYGPLNVALGVQHLQQLGVRYYIAYSPSVVAQANADPQLQYLTSTIHWPSPGVTWRIYLVRNSPLVQGLTTLPNVVSNINGRVSWLDANTKWWLSPKDWGTVLAASGPAAWPHVSSSSKVLKEAVSPVTVSKIKMMNQSLTFHVNRVGIPVVVKISYYPRWKVTGGTGPYRVSPNLMVVVPTSKNVTLVYGATTAVRVGNYVTDVMALTGLLLGVTALRRRRKEPVYNDAS